MRRDLKAAGIQGSIKIEKSKAKGDTP